MFVQTDTKCSMPDYARLLFYHWKIFGDHLSEIYFPNFAQNNFVNLLERKSTFELFNKGFFFARMRVDTCEHANLFHHLASVHLALSQKLLPFFMLYLKEKLSVSRYLY